VTQIEEQSPQTAEDLLRRSFGPQQLADLLARNGRAGLQHEQRDQRLQAPAHRPFDDSAVLRETEAAEKADVDLAVFG